MENLFSDSNQPVLTEAEQKLLHEQAINENTPGTIIRDFQVLINLLQSTTIEVSGANQLLPMKILAEINSKLSHPIDIKLKRPVQKSYPYINGLYLLLRACAICHIQTKGKKQLLVLDETARQSWLTLNTTERYFNLLETWIMWSNHEIIGESSDFLGTLSRCLYLWNSIPDEGLKYSRYEDQNYLSYIAEYHNIALLDLFGFLSIQHGHAQPDKGWRIAGVKRLPFGDAMIKLLNYINNQGLHKLIEASDQEELESELDDNEIKFGILKSYFQAYFPEWENNLVLSELEFADGIYIFKVSLGNIWRRISVPANLQLCDFADIILDAYNFDYEHLYEFKYKDRYGSIIKLGHPYMRQLESSEDYLIGELCLQTGINITFIYDFGDRWKFNIILEKINPMDIALVEPKILESHGEAPTQYYQDDEDWEEE